MEAIKCQEGPGVYYHLKWAFIYDRLSGWFLTDSLNNRKGYTAD